MKSNVVKIGVIGTGGIGNLHCCIVRDNKEVELAFVCDIEEEVAEAKGEEFGVPYFTDYRVAIKSGLADAIIIATPHWIHPEIAIYAFKNGLHVLSEKPIAVTVSDADKMIKAAKKSKKVFVVMYQRRVKPWVQKVKELIEQGVIGEITRTLCIDPWYRSQAYYDSGTWRATWKGEGGGVLLNQAPHAIDIFIWLAGLPCKVEAKTRTRLHKIEIEDEVCALLEYKNGAWGYYYTSTCEPGDFDLHMEIAGDKGKIIVNGKDITLYRYDIPVSKFTYKAKDMWASLPVREEKIDTGADIPAGHDSIIKNFARAILKKEKLFIPGEEGLKSIEFINACILSGKTGKPVNIPVNRKEYDRLIRKLVAMSRVKNVCNVQRLPDPRFLKQ